MAGTPPRTLSVTIDSIAAGGDGVGRTEGLVIFVPRTAPGDVVTTTTTGRGHFARGTLNAVTHPSSVRIDPPCEHYTHDRCGGCQLQHMTYPAQVTAKRIIISDAMQRIGKREIEPPEVHPSPNEWRYRAKLTLALRRSTGGGWIAGLHAFDDPTHVFALSDCPITDRRVVAAWREIMAASKFFPEVREFRGSVRWTEDGPIFIVMGGSRWFGQDAFFEAVPTLSVLYWEPDDAPRRILGDRRVTLDRAGGIPARPGPSVIRRPGASFAQVNPVVAEELRAYVRERVMSYAPKYVVDAYSGNGDLAAELSERGIAVTAIELDVEASTWTMARLSDPSHAVTGRVETVLPRHLPADLLVLNPPRAGLHEKVPRIIQRMPPPTVLYISCDPATLARDVARLPGYRIQAMRAFDMFPQTAHVETVCELVRESA